MDGSTSSGGRSVDICLSNYKLGKTLCFWKFGRVKFAEHVLSGDKVSIYIISRRWTENKQMEENVRREINILRRLRHPHIIQIYEVVETATSIYVIMECVESGDLFDYIIVKGWLQEEEARKIFQQIIFGVEYCHNNMVAHRDLRPENIFLDSKCNVKIADFSLSKTMQYGQLLKTSCGSTNYAAPEVISGKLYVGSKVDVWSCGVILYALLCGSLPFDEENIPKLYKNIKGGVYTIPSYLSPSASDLISRLLEVDPMKRITILEIHQHPWFKIYLPHYLALPPPQEKVQPSKKEELSLDDPDCKSVLIHLLSRLSWLLPEKLINVIFRCLDEEFYTSTWFFSKEDNSLEFEKIQSGDNGSEIMTNTVGEKNLKFVI